MIKICKVLNCGKKHSAKGYCYSHYFKKHRKTKRYQKYLKKTKEIRKVWVQEWAKKNPIRLKDSRLKYEYGIGLKEYNELVINQNHKCAICQFNPLEIKRVLYVDHCHITNKVRALLCFHCNTGLGHFKDNIELLQKALDYLKKHK